MQEIDVEQLMERIRALEADLEEVRKKVDRGGDGRDEAL